MHWLSRSSATSNRRANWPRHSQLGLQKSSRVRSLYFGSLANSEDNSKRANHEAATERKHQQQPNREVRNLDHTFANDADRPRIT